MKREGGAGGSGFTASVVANADPALRAAFGAPAMTGGAGRVPDALAELVLDFPYTLVNVGEIRDEDLSAEANLRAGLMLLKYATRPLEQIRALVTIVRAMRDVSWDLDLLRNYLLGTYVNVDRERLREVVRAEAPELENVLLSKAAREWLDEGREQGREQGRAEGKAQMLVALLERRFGKLDDASRARVLAANESELDRWSLQVLDATNVDAVFR